MRNSPDIPADHTGPTHHFHTFRPSLLRLQENPPSPLARTILIALLGLCTLLVCWGCFGRLDIVAVAHGKLVPKTQLKIVQPSENGIVQEILVREGDYVRKGQVLMRMDGTEVRAGRATRLYDRHRFALTLRRINAELTGQALTRHDGDPDDLFAGVLAQYQANRSTYLNTQAGYRRAVEKTRHDLAAATENKTRMGEALVHYRQQDEAYNQLSKNGHIARLMATDKHRERQEKERELKAQESVLQSAAADVERAAVLLIQTRDEYHRSLQTERVEVMAQLAAVEQELAKEERRHELLELRAPEDGVVKDVATHTPGTVVSPGTIMLTLVPHNEELLAEVLVENDDVGFVMHGQPVKLKLATFTFQKYGLLNGMVEQVGADASSRSHEKADETRTDGPERLVYKSTITLDRQFLAYNGNSYPLLPGMQVSAEIQLGTRTLIEYLLSPVAKTALEACRER